MRNALAFVVLTSACMGDIGEPVVEPDRVVRPLSVTEGALPIVTVATPAAWSSLWVVNEPPSTLVGSEAGLFELTANGTLEARAAGPVVGLLGTGRGPALIGRRDGLYEWQQGTLRLSDLSAAVAGFDALLGTRGAELWFHRPGELLRFDGARLDAIAEPMAVSRLSLTATSALFTASSAGEHVVMRPAQQAFEAQALDAELERGITALVPFGADDVLGLDGDGTLWRRMQVDVGLVWRRVALTSGPTDPGATRLTFLAADPETGAVWTGDATHLYRLLEGAVLSQPIADAPAAVQITHGGALWALRGASLTRVGRAEPVGFTSAIAPLAERHCVRCHAPNRQGQFALATAADWRARIDTIITVTTPVPPRPARMPADTLSTLSDSERTLIQQWKEDGLRE